jgi:mono/diheme cytochrome c family protein
VFFQIRLLAGSLLLITATICPALADMTVPGYDALLRSGHSTPQQRGELLLNELNCVACHPLSGKPTKRFYGKPAPDLTKAGARLTPEYIRAMIEDPSEAKPGALMPHVTHGLDRRSKSRTVDELLHYLLSLSGTFQGGRERSHPDQIKKGEALFTSIGCIACHSAGADQPADGVSLAGLGKRTTVEALTAFLKNPHQVRPARRMPDFRLTDNEASNLAVYLLRDQMKRGEGERQVKDDLGLYYNRYDGDHLNKTVFSTQPAATGRAETLSLKAVAGSNEVFGIEFFGFIELHESGEYFFELESEVSSALFIDGVEVLSNQAKNRKKKVSGNRNFASGIHSFRLAAATFEKSKPNLALRWKVPGQEKTSDVPSSALLASLPPAMQPETRSFNPNRRAFNKGQQHFANFGCSACHTPRRANAIKNLEALDPTKGCLSPEKLDKALPKYDLSDSQRADLAAVLAQGETLVSAPPSGEQRLIQLMASQNCFACHERGGIGGPDEAREKFFTMAVHGDMGDEGRLPPTLNAAGGKFKPGVLEKIVQEGGFHVRPYMATRMPSFDGDVLDELLKHLKDLDHFKELMTPVKFSEESIGDGHKLVGINGFGCVNCHAVKGYNGIGLSAVDLSTVYNRLNPGWFTKFLDNPQAINKQTRMPAFWPDGLVSLKDVADGTPKGQQEAIWNYLSLGENMPLPQGLQADADSQLLVPMEEPIVLRTFIKDASPRGIAVGFPENTHFIFDANIVSMVRAWRGDFFNPYGAWSGRNMKFYGPAGVDILELPRSATVAVLETPDSVWPRAQNLTDRNTGGTFQGYRLNENREPIFKYVQQGITIEEYSRPKLVQGGGVLIRTFDMTAENPPDNAFVLAAEGPEIIASSGVKWQTVMNGVPVSILMSHSLKAIVTKEGENHLLKIPVVFQQGKAKVEYILQW